MWMRMCLRVIRDVLIIISDVKDAAPYTRFNKSLGTASLTRARIFSGLYVDFRACVMYSSLIMVRDGLLFGVHAFLLLLWLRVSSSLFYFNLFHRACGFHSESRFAYVSFIYFVCVVQIVDVVAERLWKIMRISITVFLCLFFWCGCATAWLRLIVHVLRVCVCVFAKCMHMKVCSRIENTFQMLSFYMHCRYRQRGIEKEKDRETSKCVIRFAEHIFLLPPHFLRHSDFISSSECHANDDFDDMKMCQPYIHIYMTPIHFYSVETASKRVTAFLLLYLLYCGIVGDSCALTVWGATCASCALIMHVCVIYTCAPRSTQK